MRELIREGLGEQEDCSYLPDQRSTMRYREIENCSAATYMHMLERGWRRFGTLFFRPSCALCQECMSLRVDLERFRPSRSMRRVLRRNQDLQVVVQRPTLSRQHLDLYDRYHADMATRKDWPQRVAEPVDYLLTFVQGHQDYGHEILFFDQRQLVAVALVDVLPRAVSAVYTFYDPAARWRSPGVYSVLREMELARSRGVPFVYLGYRVAANLSMSYKARYRPHQLLVARPEIDEQPEWREP